MRAIHIVSVNSHGFVIGWHCSSWWPDPAEMPKYSAFFPAYLKAFEEWSGRNETSFFSSPLPFFPKQSGYDCLSFCLIASWLFYMTVSVFQRNDSLPAPHPFRNVPFAVFPSAVYLLCREEWPISWLVSLCSNLALNANRAVCKLPNYKQSRKAAGCFFARGSNWAIELYLSLMCCEPLPLSLPSFAYSMRISPKLVFNARNQHMSP